MDAETISLIIKIVPPIGSFIIGCASTGIALAKALKDKRKAKTVAEAEAATADIKEHAKELIIEAESVYKTVDKLLKQQGNSAGQMKKDSVMTKLQAYAASKNYAFDFETWSDEIDKIVMLTRQVNSK